MKMILKLELLDCRLTGLFEVKYTRQTRDDKNVLNTLSHLTELDLPAGFRVRGVNTNQGSNPRAVDVGDASQIQNQLPVPLLQQIFGFRLELVCFLTAAQRPSRLDNGDFHIVHGSKF